MTVPSSPLSENAALAAELRDYAQLLTDQNASGFRIAAYRRAADTLDGLKRPVRDILVTEGRDGLIALPGVGRGIASALAEMVRTGRWSQLDRLRGATDAVWLLQTVPGVGPELAQRIHDRLHVDTLEALELAAHDGRLEQVPAFGSRRVQMVRAGLAERLGCMRIHPDRHSTNKPTVSALLDIDREYRAKAAAGALPKIAPKRFNPDATARLPILHTRREPWEFTALYSNSWLAHELGRTKDRVIIYYHADDKPEELCTVVTETQGALARKRIIRGREEECRALEAGVSVAPEQGTPGPSRRAAVSTG
jgi:hypothetical protein